MTMPIELPPVLQTYFRAKNAHNIAAIIACFADDAVVHDEGEELRGAEAIQAWIEKTTAKYRVTAEPVKLEEENGETIVTARVSGDFPGSPIDLRFFFSLQGEKIKSLAIRS